MTPDGWPYDWPQRTLTAQECDGPWYQWDDDADEHVERDGTHWTVIDRDTGELIGSFGMKVEVATCEEALDEAERFGSKWGWPVDRDAVQRAPDTGGDK